jgi:hypothetical protein
MTIPTVTPWPVRPDPVIPYAARSCQVPFGALVRAASQPELAGLIGALLTAGGVAVSEFTTPEVT